MVGATGIVLVAEPDRRIAALVERALAQEGVPRIRQVAPAQVPALLSRLPAVLIIADIVIGDPQSRSLLVSARAHRVPTVAMSADPATILACVEAGLPLLRKPFALQDLIAAALPALGPAR